MGNIGITLLVLLAVASLVLGIIGVALGGGAGRRLFALERELKALRAELERERLAARARAATAEPSAREAPVALEDAGVAPLATEARVATEAANVPDTRAAEAIVPPDVPPDAASAGSLAKLLSKDEVEGRLRSASMGSLASPGLRSASSGDTSDRVERALGLVWATRIGAAMLLLGVIFFFKVAFDRDWLGPWARVGLGVGAGLVCIGLAARFRKRLHDGWIGAMVGLGLAILLAALWVAHALYGLVPGWVAFVALSAFAVGAGALALRWELEAVLVSATTAGFINLAALSGSFPGHALFMTFGAVLAGAALFTAAKRQWLLAVVAVPLGLVPALLSRHFGAPYGLDDVLGPALPQPGGLDTVCALAAALAVSAMFVAAARRVLVHVLVSGTLSVAAVVLPLMLACMLVPPRLPLAIFVAGLALAVALERHLLEAARGERAAMPLDLLHLAMHGLGALTVLVLTVAAPGPRLDAELGPALAFVLVGIASATALGSRARSGLGAIELATLAGFALLWGVAHGDWDEAQPTAVVLALATAGALGLVLLRERGRGEAATRMAAAIAITALLVLALFRLSLPGPWTTLALAALAAVLVYASSGRLGRDAGAPRPAWVVWLGVAVLGLALITFLGVDVMAPGRDRVDFMASNGAVGAYLPAPFIGPRGLPLIAIAVVALAFSRLGRRARADAEGGGAAPARTTFEAVVRVSGFALALAYVLDQAALVVAHGATSGVAATDWDLLYDAVREASDATVVVLTAAMALFGAGVLAWGFAARARLDRWVGLGIVALALLKLVTYDLSVMDSVARTIVLVSFGALLLGSGFLYARFAPGVKTLLGVGGKADDGTPPAG